MSARWSTPEDVVAKVRRRWTDGSLLRAFAEEDVCPRLEVPLRGPRASEIGEDLDAARAWVSALEKGSRDGRRYTLEWTSIGGRHFGRNEVPSRAVISSYDQAWSLLGVEDEVRSFARVLTLSAPREPVREWVLNRPHKAVELAGEWERMVAAHDWLDTHRGSHRYLREISAPGVDTKFAERHRPVLAGMLGVGTTAAGFLQGLGLRAKPEMVRLRFDSTLGLPTELSEIAVRADELGRVHVAPRVAVVVENEVSYLSVPLPQDGVVIWGKGFEVDRVGKLPWLSACEVVYWGDLDTHGFAILDRLRAWLPHTRSVLMDVDTLVGHQDRWVIEERPTSAVLTRLTDAEAHVYEGLVSDHWGERVRLEQERVDWGWAEAQLPR